MEKIGKERDIIDKSDETKYRSIRLVEKSDETPEGDGFIVHQILSFTIYSESKSFLTFR